MIVTTDWYCQRQKSGFVGLPQGTVLSNGFFFEAVAIFGRCEGVWLCEGVAWDEGNVVLGDRIIVGLGSEQAWGNTGGQMSVS